MRRMHCSSKSASCSSRRPIPWQYSKQVLGPKIQTSFHVCGQYYQPVYLTSVRMIYKIACFANMTVFFSPSTKWLLGHLDQQCPCFANRDEWLPQWLLRLSTPVEGLQFRRNEVSKGSGPRISDVSPTYVACHHPKYTTIGYLFWGWLDVTILASTKLR